MAQRIASTGRRVRSSERPVISLDREMLTNKQISYGARGLLSSILAMPDDCTFLLKQLEIQGAGRDKVRGYIKELVEAGYAVLKTYKNDEGKITARAYDFFDVPVSPTPAKKTLDSQTDRQENHLTEKPSEGFSVNKIQSLIDTRNDSNVTLNTRTGSNSDSLITTSSLAVPLGTDENPPPKAETVQEKTPVPVSQSSLFAEPAPVEPVRTRVRKPLDDVWDAVTQGCFGAVSGGKRVGVIIYGNKKIAGDIGLLKLYFGTDHKVTDEEARELAKLLQEAVKWTVQEGLHPPRNSEALCALLNDYKRSPKYRENRENEIWFAQMEGASM